jgi:hypothetical protein
MVAMGHGRPLQLEQSFYFAQAGGAEASEEGKPEELPILILMAFPIVNIREEQIMRAQKCATFRVVSIE